MDCSLPGSSVHEILQARTLEWIAMPSSRESSLQGIFPTSRDRTHISSVSCIGRWVQHATFQMVHECHIFYWVCLFDQIRIRSTLFNCLISGFKSLSFKSSFPISLCLFPLHSMVKKQNVCLVEIPTIWVLVSTSWSKLLTCFQVSCVFCKLWFQFELFIRWLI